LINVVKLVGMLRALVANASAKESFMGKVSSGNQKMRKSLSDR